MCKRHKSQIIFLNTCVGDWKLSPCFWDQFVHVNSTARFKRTKQRNPITLQRVKVPFTCAHVEILKLKITECIKSIIPVTQHGDEVSGNNTSIQIAAGCQGV